MFEVSYNSKTSDIPVGSGVMEDTMVLNLSDLSHSCITTVKFDSSNYLAWSKVVLIFIQGKDKEDYLTGEIDVPTSGDPKYKKWKKENALVMGWLLNSIKPEISGHYLFLDIAHKIWSSQSQTYSEVGHTTKVYDLRQQISKFKHCDLPFIYLLLLSLENVERIRTLYYLPSIMCEGFYCI